MSKSSLRSASPFAAQQVLQLEQVAPSQPGHVAGAPDRRPPAVGLRLELFTVEARYGHLLRTREDRRQQQSGCSLTSTKSVFSHGSSRIFRILLAASSFIVSGSHTSTSCTRPRSS